MVAIVLMIGGGLIVGVHLSVHGPLASESLGAGRDSASGEGEAARASQPAWGRIEYVPLAIAPPLELVPEYEPLHSYHAVWRFPNTPLSQFGELLANLGLSEGLQSALDPLARADTAINGVVVHPSLELVLGMSADDRAKLYVALSEHEENFDQVKAFRFCGSSLEQWFHDSSLLPATWQLVSPLVYRHNGYLFFADLRNIEGMLVSPSERLTLLKAISHESTFLARLRVDRHSDVEALVRYWGRGGRANQVRPIIESLANADRSQTISIGMLLPPFARQRLYTYPPPPDKRLAARRDCHWSAMNFFSDEPDDRFCDVAEVGRALNEDYRRIEGDLQLGDLVLFFSGPDSAIHSAVYIADDILFTKNGPGSSRPWMLTKLDDMKGFYPSLKPLDVHYYRRKDL